MAGISKAGCISGFISGCISGCILVSNIEGNKSNYSVWSVLHFCHDTKSSRSWQFKFQKLKETSVRKCSTGHFEFPGTYKKSLLVHFMTLSLSYRLARVTLSYKVLLYIGKMTCQFWRQRSETATRSWPDHSELNAE